MADHFPAMALGLAARLNEATRSGKIQWYAPSGPPGDFLCFSITLGEVLIVVARDRFENYRLTLTASVTGRNELAQVRCLEVQPGQLGFETFRALFFAASAPGQRPTTSQWDKAFQAIDDALHDAMAR